MDHESIVYNLSSNKDSNAVVKANAKKFNYKGLLNTSYSLGNSINDRFSISFLGSGSLSLPNVLYTLVTILVMVFVIRSIMYYGTDISSFSFSDLLSYFSNYSFSVDFRKVYAVFQPIKFPDWLSFLEGIVNGCNAILRVLVMVAETLVNVILFLASLFSFLLGVPL